MDVLEQEHRRSLLGQPLEEDARGREEVLLIPDHTLLQAEQVGEPGLDEPAFLRVGQVLLDRGSELRLRLVALLVLDDSRSPAHHLRERPESDAFPVCETATRVPPDPSGEAVDVLLELPGEARLSDPADADDGDEMRPPILRRSVEELLDEAKLAVTPDERRLQPGELHRSSAQSDNAGRVPELERLGLALQSVRACVLEDDRSLSRSLRRLADQHGPRIGGGLDA